MSHPNRSQSLSPTGTPPRVDSSGSLDAERSAILHELARDLWTCRPGIWFDTYTPHAVGSDDNLVNGIVRLLKENQDTSPVLDDDGWILIREDVCACKTEDQVFSHLNTITSRVVQHAINLKPELGQNRKATLEWKPREKTYSEAIGWKCMSDWGAMQRSPNKNDSCSNLEDDISVHAETHKSTRAPSLEKLHDPSEHQRVFDETMDIAIIGEFKVGQCPSDRVDVGAHSSCCCIGLCVTSEEREEDSWGSNRNHVHRPSPSLCA